MLDLFEYSFNNRTKFNLQHFSITGNCVLCFCCYCCLLDCHVQNMHENDMFQVFSCHKHLADSLNFCKLLMKQVFKILYHLTEAFLLLVVSHCVHELFHVHIEWHVFFVILILVTHFFWFCCHNLLLCEQNVFSCRE